MKKIVIVEDEFRTRQGLGHLINKVDLGCRVIGEAENGYEGLKMIRSGAGYCNYRYPDAEDGRSGND